jgi:putative holliday junction resolvase
VAVSDATGLLARPVRTIDVRGRDAVSEVVRILDDLTARDDEPLGGVVVGLPRRLDGTDHDQTAVVRDFVARLRTVTDLPVHLQDERLSSLEAESRLALREKDWRKRKQMLDAAAAAVILQDYLDAHPQS